MRVIRSMTPEAGRDIGKRSINFLRYVVSILLYKVNAASTQKGAFYKITSRVKSTWNVFINPCMLRWTRRKHKNESTIKRVYPTEYEIYYKESIILPRWIAWAWKWDTGHSPIPRFGRFRSVRSLLEASIRISSVSSRLSKSSGKQKDGRAEVRFEQRKQE